MEYFSELKRNELSNHEKTWRKLNAHDEVHEASVQRPCPGWHAEGSKLVDAATGSCPYEGVEGRGLWEERRGHLGPWNRFVGHCRDACMSSCICQTRRMSASKSESERQLRTWGGSHVSLGDIGSGGGCAFVRAWAWGVGNLCAFCSVKLWTENWPKN